jgi:cell division protein FtsZ
MEGAKGVLMSIAGGSDLGLFEINEAATLVQEEAHPDANIIFGTVVDDSLGDEVRVTVIAAGFEGGSRQVGAGGGQSRRGRHHIDDDESVPGASGDTAGAAGLGSTPLDGRRREEHRDEPATHPGSGAAGSRRRDEDDDIDVPPFMRH